MDVLRDLMTACYLSAGSHDICAECARIGTLYWMQPFTGMTVSMHQGQVRGHALA